ncbi:hypothetical protein BESB_081890 [Besnoitia besnoiti]|uniref:C2H2-type domain-containing protein n=1 Tax=Besnoitia besnoiti TaxID=94643 RepID=A0A2A9MC68_BESBE|nr:hypothetical protein BESB_081890 [Besnoitia besnoiti]PFH32990.1 hypothetical protein BESB_081890 [Besnoitia besnoiti]
MEVPVPGASFSCRCCRATFASALERKEHQRSDWHAYNLRRSVGNLAPVSKEDFARKMQVALLASQLKQDKSRDKQAQIDAAVRLQRTLQGLSSASPSAPRSEAAAVAPSSSSSSSALPSTEKERAQAVATLTALGVLSTRGEDHLKARKADKARALPREACAAEGEDATSSASDAGVAAGSYPTAAELEASRERARLRAFALSTEPECVSLFDAHAPFRTWRECLSYMTKTFGFVVPHAEYLVDAKAFLRLVWRAQLRRPRCLLCEKRFSSVLAAQQHMQSKGHTQLRWTESAEETSALQRALMEACYDFRASYLALLARRRDKLPFDGRARAAIKDAEADSDAESDGDDGDSDSWEDVSSSDDEDDSDDEPCEASRLREATHGLSAREFKRVVRQCGEMQARLTETGDLRLPDGRELVNRHVAYIYKQRLVRRLPGEAEAQVLADFHANPRFQLSAHNLKTSLARLGGRQTTGLSASALEHLPLQHRQQLATRLRQEKHHRLLLSSLGRNGRGLSEQALRLSEREIKRKVLAPRRAFVQREAKQRMRLGVKQNKLQKFILQETKFFF